MSTHMTKLLSAAAVAMVALAVFAVGAQAATPAKGYEAFAGCPTTLEAPQVTTCLRTEITGGNFKMGNKNVPISKTMVLSGGANGDLKEFAASPAGGLTAVKQQVPGGVIGLTGLDWLVNFLNVEALQLFAVTELAGTPDFSGLAPHLPIKVHLINPVLGSKCYVGSSANPIDLNLTMGTTSPPPPNKPISGHEPTSTEFDFETEILKANNALLVDNSFAAPGANGCVLTLLGFIPIDLDGIVNLASSLPSAAGTNETKQNVNLSIAPETRVYP